MPDFVAIAKAGNAALSALPAKAQDMLARNETRMWTDARPLDDAHRFIDALFDYVIEPSDTTHLARAMAKARAHMIADNRNPDA